MSAAEETIAAIATATGGGVGIPYDCRGRVREPIARAVVPVAAAGCAVASAVPRARARSGERRDPRPGARGRDARAAVVHGGRRRRAARSRRRGGDAGDLVRDDPRAGARLAGPGEFTRRAFFGGKIDLSQAEAVAGIIAADDAAIRCARRRRCDKARSAIASSARERLIVGALAEASRARSIFPTRRRKTRMPARALRARG